MCGASVRQGNTVNHLLGDHPAQRAAASSLRHGVGSTAITADISADTVVPSPSDPQQLNRYAYARGNPLKYTDPTGHYTYEGGSCAVGSDDCDPTVSSYTGRVFQDVLGSDGQLYDTGPYGVEIKTRFLGPAEAKKYFGAAVPQRVRMSTVVDPTGEGLRAILMAWGFGLGSASSRMPNWFFGSSPNFLEGNPIASDVFPEPYKAPGTNVVRSATSLTIEGDVSGGENGYSARASELNIEGSVKGGKGGVRLRGLEVNIAKDVVGETGGVKVKSAGDINIGGDAVGRFKYNITVRFSFLDYLRQFLNIQ